MKRTDDPGRLRHMLDHAREAVEMARAKNRADLDTDRMLNLALVRLLEIIGEAAARVSPQCQASMPQVPWPAIVGLRNRLVHGYDEVDFDIAWDIIQLDLPPLIVNLQRALTNSADEPCNP